jgi:hypothetical protein
MVAEEAKKWGMLAIIHQIIKYKNSHKIVILSSGIESSIGRKIPELSPKYDPRPVFLFISPPYIYSIYFSYFLFPIFK